MKEETKEWLAKAKNELRAAEYNLNANFFEVSAFYFQQSVEKALKALQIEKLGKFDRIHSLEMLAKSVKAPKNILKACEFLSPFYVTTRYPNQKAISNKNKVVKALKLAKEAIKWVSLELRS